MPVNLFTQLEILSFDRIAFAHSLTVAGYECELQNQGYGIYGETPDHGGVLEIGFVEQNPVILTGEFGELRIPENCIFVIPPNTGFSVRTETNGIHRHTCAEFLVRCRCVRVEDCPPPVGNIITLPLIIAPSQESAETFDLIRAIVCAQNARLNRSYFEECADFMRLLSRLADLVQENRDTALTSPGNRRYCDRVKLFVSEHIGRRITVGEVAEAVGISKNYLTNIFSTNEGMSLTEYINRRKLSYMLELVRRYGYTLAQAGEHVGFRDVNYISRIFKRYYGMTATEYRRTMQLEELL